MSVRPVERVIRTKPTIEGAGVKLERAFGSSETIFAQDAGAAPRVTRLQAVPSTREHRRGD